ncbi:MAG: cobyrinate a,c-diamide synthase [Ardenticatenaceae bacterium]
MSTPFLVIAGATSGTGKTTLTAGIIGALRRRGLRVQPFKVGPDYIDPTYHRMAAGRPCRNIDSWMVEPTKAVAMAHYAAREADVAIVEGVMGLYDGASYDEEVGSTAHIAKLLGAPVVLVLDVGKAARSAGALALGFQQFDPTLPLAGFITNRCGSTGHADGVRRAIERATDLPVLGWLPKEQQLSLPSRHLGLVPLHEDPTLRAAIEKAADLVEQHLDLDRLLDVAAWNRSNDPSTGSGHRFSRSAPGTTEVVTTVRIGVARDAAFSFYYEDNIDLLRAAGAEIIDFSPIHDANLPEKVSGLYLGGGFPELYAAQLSANHPMQEAIRGAIADGMPIYAECGGFMYLTEAILDVEGVRHPMINVVPGVVTMQRRRVRLGYCEVRADNWLLSDGTARGHEFHWSSWDGNDDTAPAFEVQARRKRPARPVGYATQSLVASYVHLHFASNTSLAENFVRACRAWNW